MVEDRRLTKVPFCEPLITAADREAVAAQLATGWIGPGDAVRRLEAFLEGYTNSPNVILTSSGTAALYAIARRLRADRDRPRVLVPGYGVRATWCAWHAAGWSVSHGDVDPKTGCLRFPRDPSLFDAICYVNFSGRTGPEIAEMREACDKANVVLVEDAACGLGHADPENRHAGTIGWFGALSFSVPKIVTGGQGGAVLVASEYDHDATAVRSLIANDAPGALNLRMTDLQAALILSQLGRLPDTWVRKGNVHGQLTAASSRVYTTPSGPPLHNVWFARNDRERDVAVEKLRTEHGIDARAQYEAFVPLEGCLAWADRAVYLPFGNALSRAQVDAVADALRRLPAP